MQIPADRSRAKVWLQRSIVSMILLILLFFGQRLWASLVSSIQSKQIVSITTIKKGDLTRFVSAYGSLRPSRISSVMAQVSGRVIEVLQRPGAILNKGDILIRRANPELQGVLDKADLELLGQKMKQKKTVAMLDQKMLSLKSDIKLTKSQLNLAEVELSAKTKLFKQQIISALEHKRAELQVEKQRLQLSMGQEKLGAFRKNRQIDLEVARLGVEKAEKQKDIALKNIENLSIRAPIDGVLMSLNEDIQPGQNISAGKAIGQIADPKSLYAELMVAAADAPKVKCGQQVTLQIKGKSLKGKVSRISPNVEKNQVIVDVSLVGPLPDTARANIEVSADITLSRVSKTLVAQRAAQVLEPNRSYNIYIRRVGSKEFKRTRVDIGALSDKQMQILKGAHVGDVILLQDSDGQTSSKESDNG